LRQTGMSQEKVTDILGGGTADNRPVGGYEYY